MKMETRHSEDCLTVYICELCKAEYDTETEALDCEKQHAIATGLTSKSYDSEKVKYPTTVRVRMSDNTVQDYVYVGGGVNIKDILVNTTVDGKTNLVIADNYKVLVQKEYEETVKNENDEEVVETKIEKLTGVGVKLEDRKLYVDIPDNIQVLPTDTICVKVFDEQGNELVADAENPIYDEVLISAEVKTVITNSNCIVPPEEETEEPAE